MNEYELLKDNDERPYLHKVKTMNYDGLEHDIFQNFSIPDLVTTYYPLNFYESEHAFIIGLDDDYYPLGIMRISIGDLYSAWIYKRTCGIFLLLSGARRFAILHNHPDNVLIPSEDDLNVLKQFQNLADLLELEFEDSYILGKEKWISTKEPSIIKEYQKIDIEEEGVLCSA